MRLGFGLGFSASKFGGAATPTLLLSAISVAEDAAIGTAVGTLSVINVPAGKTVSSYAITADPNSKFAIDGTALETAASLDYETATSHSVTIQATLSDASTISRTFAITVSDVADGIVPGELVFSGAANSGLLVLLEDI